MSLGSTIWSPIAKPVMVPAGSVCSSSSDSVVLVPVMSSLMPAATGPSSIAVAKLVTARVPVPLIAPSVRVPPAAIRLPLSMIEPVDCTAPLPCRYEPGSIRTTPAVASPSVPISIEEIVSTLTEDPLPPPITRSSAKTAALSEADSPVVGSPTPLCPLPSVSRPATARVAPAPLTTMLPFTTLSAAPPSDAPAATWRLDGAALVPRVVLAATTLPVSATSPTRPRLATCPTPLTTT